MAGVHKHAVVVGVLLVVACVLGSEAASGLVARRMAHGDMSPGSMTNLTGSPLNNTDGNITYVVATRDYARKAYPWCRTSVITSYFLRPTVTMVANTSSYTEYAFRMDEDYGLCKAVLTKKGKAKDVPTQCATPFYSFMMAISDACHEAIMSVKTVQMFTKQDVAGATTTEMYCHAHKGHDTGVPLLKYLIKPAYLTPSTAPGAKRTFVINVRINLNSDNVCQNLAALCGGNTCMVALSDEEYDTCPAWYARMV